MTRNCTDIHSLRRRISFRLAVSFAVSVAFLFASANNNAFAADLKPNIVVNADVVTLGDLLDGLEDIPGAAGKVVAKAPAPGSRGRIHVAAIASAARTAGVAWRPEIEASRITVERAGLLVSQQDLEAIIGDVVKRDFGIATFRLNLPLRGRSLYIPTDHALADIRVDDLQLDTRTDRYSARLSLPAGGGDWSTLDLRGRLERITHVPTLARAVAVGETIGKHDIRWVEMTLRQVGFNTLRESSQLIGMTPRRNVTPGRPIRNGDLERPALVRKGSMVSLNYRIGNLTISAMGRALERGGRGDIVRILNTASNKTVEARVTGPDAAEVMTPGRLAVIASNY